MKTNTLVNLIAAVDFAVLLVATVALLLTVDRFNATGANPSATQPAIQHDRFE